MNIKNDLVYLRWAYDMYGDFIKFLYDGAKQMDVIWDISGIIYLMQFVDWNDWNIEHYLWMKYWEKFVLAIYQIKNDPSKIG